MAQRSAVNLADVVRHVLNQLSGAAADANVTVRSTPRAAPTAGDPVLVVRNSGPVVPVYEVETLYARTGGT